MWKSIKLSRLRKSFLCRIFPSSLKAQNSFVSISCNIENIVVDLKSYRSHNWNKPAMMFLSEFIALQESGEWNCSGSQRRWNFRNDNKQQNAGQKKLNAWKIINWVLKLSGGWLCDQITVKFVCGRQLFLISTFPISP